MATLLLIVIYIAFISLGLPDSLFGSAWPVVYLEFSIPVSLASLVSLISCGGTILSSLNSARIIHRFGVGKVTAFSTLLTAVSLFGYTRAPSFVWLCLLSLPLGLGAGAIDTGLNNYVALHYKAIHMNMLHCFYGVGVTISPYLMSLALADRSNWRGGYQMAAILQLSIAVLLFISLPLWKTHKSTSAPSSVEEVPVKLLGLRALSKIPAVRMVWLVFITSCGIEVTTGAWGSTFLVQSKGMAVDVAARTITFYYLGFALGRFISGILSQKLTCWQLIRYSQLVVLCSFIFLLLPLGSFSAGIGLFLIGLGNGPVFPNMTHLAPINFGREISQSVIGSQMAFSYISIMVLPPLFGLLTQWIGAWLLPWYLMILFIGMLYAVARLIAMMKIQGRYQ